jgi:hypothetical protein
MGWFTHTEPCHEHGDFSRRLGFEVMIAECGQRRPSVAHRIVGCSVVNRLRERV